MISTESSRAIMLRFRKKPNSPIKKSTALRIRNQLAGIINPSSRKPPHPRVQSVSTARSLKRQNVIGKQTLPDRLRTAGKTRPRAASGLDVPYSRGNQKEKKQTQRDSDEFQPPKAVGTIFVRRQIQQHDDEYKQNHDGARVHDDLNHCKEVSAKQDKQTGHRGEHENQRECAVEHVLLREHVDGCSGGECRKEEKQYLNHEMPTTKLVASMFASESGSRTFQPNFISWS